MRRILTTLAAVGLLAGACSTDDALDSTALDNTAPGGDATVDGSTVELTSSLSGFDSCDALLDHLRTEGAERVGPWGFDNGWFGVFPVEGDVDFATEDAASDTTTAAEAPAPDASGGDGATAYTQNVDFSGTNVQETGIDEADIVKTDGERIFIVAGGELVVVDVASRSVTGTAAVSEGDRAELFIDGDDVLLLQQGWTDSGTETEPGIAIDSFRGGSSHTTITRITLDNNVPRIAETVTADGDYVSARATEGTARIIVRSNPQQSFPFVFPQDESGESRAEESNRDALLGSELSDWLPGYTRADANGTLTDEGLLVPCEQVHAPTEFAGFGVLSVLTVDIGGTIDPTTTSSVLAPGDIVYASPESVYIATTAWMATPFLTDDVAIDRLQSTDSITTSIHRFDITSATSAAYTASGTVDGTVRDSYSFSEHEGSLRVVTTTGGGVQDDTESFVRVLQERNGSLVEVGSVGDMGNGEAVQSVRFQGEIGYVVTFRQVDPLYTLDLSDPENPAVRGELKIPGFSSYLHPIGDGLVIGVGSDADENTGQTTGSKVSLFDVSDLANPREIATWTGPDAWNNIGWDTHAFLWWGPERIAVVPVQTWNQGEQWSGVVLLRIENDTITEVGRIDHTDDTITTGETDCSVLSEDDLSSVDADRFTTELEYIITEGYGLVLDCGPGEEQSATGFECNADEWITDEAEAIGVEPAGTVVYCFPIGNGVPQISRSLILPGNQLWTVSSPWGWLGGANPARLQMNDLGSLERLAALDLQ